MSKTKNLGRRGEADARRLLDAYDLGQGFEVCWVLSPHEDARRELRHRLSEQARQVIEVQPGQGTSFASHFEGQLRRLTTGETRPVIWVESNPYSEPDWIATLAALNQTRNTFAREAPFFLVMAGPLDLGALAPHQAPDFWSVRSQVAQLPNAAQPTGNQPVRWLHLSDLHFRDKERWEQRATLQALRRAIEEQQLQPDLVFVTGDIAFSGKDAEYKQAEEFLRKLAEDLKLDARERFFVVPGNHDVDRSQITPPEKWILDALENEQRVSETLSDKGTLGLITRRLQNFYTFTQRLLGPARGLNSDKLARTDVVDVDGILVGILGLNSAWAAAGTSADKGRLLIGAETVQTALAETEDALFRIALMHHPSADLRDFDQEKVDSLLASPKGVAFVLRGHRHKTGALVHRSPSGQFWELAAGATYDEGEGPRGFLYGELDLAAGKGKVLFFTYSENSGGYFHPDNGAYKECKDGVWSFELPEYLRLGNPEDRTLGARAQISPARQRNLAERYRDAAAAVQGTSRLIGVAARSDRPNVTTPAMFVPLSFQVERISTDSPWDREPTVERISIDSPLDREPAWNMARLIQALTQRSMRDDAPRAGAHIVVLGDPGSGKTTLCRYLTVVLAKGTDGVPALAEGSLPLFLPFRDYVVTARNRPDLSLVEYLELQSKRDLSVTLPEGFLEQKLENGEAVLLLDGLDEVGQASEREVMRGRVVGFCESFPMVPVLVTSRITGYGDAPLPALFKGYFTKVHKNGSVESQAVLGAHFDQLRVVPFDDSALEVFVRRWYELMEPENPSIRNERIADLLAALEAEPRVKELARNPLLATLIALIHRSEAHLPGERAELYERCVQTLIIDWPAARRNTFKEIDEGLQRRYLEELALEMQRKRGGVDNELVIGGGHSPDAGASCIRAFFRFPISNSYAFSRQRRDEAGRARGLDRSLGVDRSTGFGKDAVYRSPRAEPLHESVVGGT